MKRFTLLFIVVVIAVLFVCGPVYAGFFGNIKDAALSTIGKGVIGGIFFILTYFFGVKVKRWRKVANEGLEFGLTIYESAQPDSPGGAKITKDEIENILKEGGEFGIAVFGAFGKKNSFQKDGVYL